MIKIQHSPRILCILLILLASSVSLVGQTQNQELAQLRHQLALNYLDPRAHMELAKHFWLKGDRLQAFYLVEYARKNSFFPPAQFMIAFQRAFGGNADPAQTKQAEAAFKKGIELQNAGELKQAEESFVQAAALAPRSVGIQSWVGRFFFKVKHDDERALSYYLNAYFLDPHAYETEFVESRVRTINYDAATFRYRELIRRDTGLREILKDSNPTVVVIAIAVLADEWRPEYLKPLLECLSHDDEEVRWDATQAIKKHVDRSFDETLKDLLQSNDLRIRGLAAYIAVYLWKQQSFDLMRSMLRDNAQLLRFDAMSALSIDGGREGQQILRAYRAYEKHPKLREMLNSEP